jgi:GntR family transcriptional regulator, transcriptional repressor for pyruvate dehydrogenase complex
MPGRVSSVTKSEAVAAYVRSQIHVGNYSPGDRLPTQRELAEQLGVSRISVSEAIKLLANEGYVQVLRGSSGGAFVTQLVTPVQEWRSRLRDRAGELDELIDFRQAVEAKAAALAAERRTTTDLTRMRHALEAMRTIPATNARSWFRQSDGTFHIAISHAARNARLERAIDEARMQLFTPYDLLVYEEPVADVLADHQEIYDAIRDRDGERAGRLMSEHIEHTRHQLRSFVHDD